jgi:thiol-disulfide isomerase/thioredoxin/outer membrane lipoprotein-sorting protein
MPLPLLVPPALFVSAPTFRDDKAAALLAEVAAKGKALKSFSTDVTMTMTGPEPQKMTGKIRVQNPGKGRLELAPEKGPALLIVSDGTSAYNITGKTYVKTPSSNETIWPFLTGINGADASKFVYKGTETLGEVTYDVLEMIEATQTHRAYISPEKIIQRYIMTFSAGDKKIGQDIALANIQLDPELAAENFTLPAGLEEAKAPAGGDGMEALNAKLLKVGTTAPAFNLATPAGGKLSLAQALKGKKAVLVNFWFFNCGPCRAEHPELQKLYTSLKAKGFGLVAVDQGDDNKTITDYLKKAGLTFPAVKGIPGTFTAYGVQAFPTNYLVGANGKILYRSVGFDEAGLKAALAKAGLK